MIDKQHKTIFIHIPKNGGTSIKKTLNISTLGNHKTAIQERDGYAEWDRYYKFAFIRNPWDRLVSIFHYYKYSKDNAHAGTRKITPDSFEDFIYKFFNEPEYLGIITHPILMIQKNWICDEDDNIIVDYVARFENYVDNLNVICDKLKIKNVNAHERKSLNRHSDYRIYFNDKSLDIVNNRLKEDIIFFNYKF